MARPKNKKPPAKPKKRKRGGQKAGAARAAAAAPAARAGKCLLVRLPVELLLSVAASLTAPEALTFATSTPAVYESLCKVSAAAAAAAMWETKERALLAAQDRALCRVEEARELPDAGSPTAWSVVGGWSDVLVDAMTPPPSLAGSVSNGDFGPAPNEDAFSPAPAFTPTGYDVPNSADHKYPASNVGYIALRVGAAARGAFSRISGTPYERVRCLMQCAWDTAKQAPERTPQLQTALLSTESGPRTAPFAGGACPEEGFAVVAIVRTSSARVHSCAIGLVTARPPNAELPHLGLEPADGSMGRSWSWHSTGGRGKVVLSCPNLESPASGLCDGDALVVAVAPRRRGAAARVTLTKIGRAEFFVPVGECCRVSRRPPSPPPAPYPRHPPGEPRTHVRATDHVVSFGIPAALADAGLRVAAAGHQCAVQLVSLPSARARLERFWGTAVHDSAYASATVAGDWRVKSVKHSAFHFH